MRVIKETIGMFASNAYIVACEETGSCVIIDAGDDGGRLADTVREHDWTVEKFLLTHGHIDHVGGLPNLRRAFPDVPAMMHPDDNFFVTNLQDHARMFGLQMEPVDPIEEELHEGDVIEIGTEIRLEVRETPGHSPGSVSFVSEKGNQVFSGDLIFQQSIGRTDLPGGSLKTLLNSVEEKIVPLGDETILHPGHMGQTIVGRERASNPFLNLTPEELKQLSAR